MPSAQGHITVRRKAKDGADGVSRWLEPSVTEIRRYQTGDFSVATISCKKKRQVGANAPETASECTMRYTYTKGGTETTVDNYTGSNVTIGLWWSKIVFELLLNGTVIASKEVPVIDTPASVGQNLLNGTNFKDEPDAGTTFSANKEVLENEVDGQAAIRCVGTSFSNSAEQNLLSQKIITGTTEVRVMPSTWYTLSFWARSSGYVQEDINTTFNTYGISNVPTFQAVAGVKYRLVFNGYVDAQSVTEGRQLKVFVYRKVGSTWYDQHSASISSTTAATQLLEFTPDYTGTYYIHAHLYPNLSGGTGQARVNWYRLYSYRLVSFVHPSLIDTSAVQVSDGIISASKPSDGHNDVELTDEWVRHTFTFKTKSTLPTSDQKVLFRMPSCCYGMGICMPKLERGVFATDWCRSERDKTGAQGNQGIAGCILRVSEWAEGVEFHNDEALTTGTRYLDIAVVTTGANTFNAYKCKQTHTSSSSIPVTNTTYWQPFNNLLPIYTPLIMAQYATLRFTQTNQLLVMDGNDIVSALGKGDYPLWIGGATAAAAPFKVSKAGKLIATSGEFSGNIRSIIKELHESDAESFSVSFPANAHGFKLNNDLNLRTDRYIDYTYPNLPSAISNIAIVLPRSTDYIGSRVVLWNGMTPPYTRVDISGYFSTLLCENIHDRIHGFPANLQNGSTDFYNWDDPNYIKWIGGIIELVGVPGVSLDLEDSGEPICAWCILSINAVSYEKGVHQ